MHHQDTGRSEHNITEVLSGYPTIIIEQYIKIPDPAPIRNYVARKTATGSENMCNVGDHRTTSIVN